MAPLKLHRIIHCSSQDPAFPAENLLKDGTSNKWKCKTWELMASVVIQLEKPSVISGIDIGNESSAFVEVLVGSDSHPSKFEIILSMSPLMTPVDSQNSQHTNQVRIFRLNDLHLPVCTEKWDKIKVVCSQPFNRVMKYGLSFIRLHGYQAEIEECSPSGLGQIGLLASPLLKDSYRKKTPRKVATPKAKDLKGNTPTNADRSKTPNKKAANETKKTPRKQDFGNGLKDMSPAVTTPSKRPSQDEPSSSQAQKHLKLDPNVTSKPFNKILEGVELAISGYVNPGRADIRSKACSMGAKYWTDWTSTSTHLICAFPNTPKFQKVKGSGKIVTRHWVDDCFKERKRLPWRRYATDSDDGIGSSGSDEEEVSESGKSKNGNETSSTVGGGADAAAGSGRTTSSGPRVSNRFIATVEQIERLRATMLRQSNDTDTSSVVESSSADGKDTSLGSQIVDPVTVTAQHVESSKPDCIDNPPSKKEENKVQSEAIENKLPEIPDFFKNKYFYIHPSISKGQMERVERCIVAFCGSLCTILDQTVHFAIAKKKLKNEDDAIGVPYVKPEWIWKCNDAGEMVSICDYLL